MLIYIVDMPYTVVSVVICRTGVVHVLMFLFRFQEVVSEKNTNKFPILILSLMLGLLHVGLCIAHVMTSYVVGTIWW